MNGASILVVDDNPVNSKLARVLLAGEGYAVRIAADGVEALARIAEEPPALILMDIQLPGIDGLELTRRLKSDPRTRGIVIVALTAYAMKGDDERARAAGCDDYVAKPIDIDALPKLVARHLARKRPPQAG